MSEEPTKAAADTPRRPINHVVIYSGGMDSFTLLSFVTTMRQRPMLGDQVYALSFNYGQRHAKELQKATFVCMEHGIKHQILDISVMRSVMKGSALTDGRVAVPHGHYAAESMKQTVVPGRNTLMLACALAFAEGMRETGIVYYGAHSGDHAIYPDCRPEYIEAMQATFSIATEGRVALVVPFQRLSKGELLANGLAHGLTADEYKHTWTCYEGGEHPCGKCGACVERAEAFDYAGAPDPLIVARDYPGEAGGPT